MIKEYLNIILTDADEGNLILLERTLQDFKIPSKVKTFNTGSELMDSLHQNILTAEVLFMDYRIPGKPCLECLSEIRSNPKFDYLTTVIYSENVSPAEEEEIFIAGANVFMKKPDNYRDMKKRVADIISVTWQYYTAGLNKNNFIMKV